MSPSAVALSCEEFRAQRGRSWGAVQGDRGRAAVVACRKPNARIANVLNKDLAGLV